MDSKIYTQSGTIHYSTRRLYSPCTGTADSSPSRFLHYCTPADRSDANTENLDEDRIQDSTAHPLWDSHSRTPSVYTSPTLTKTEKKHRSWQSGKKTQISIDYNSRQPLWLTWQEQTEHLSSSSTQICPLCFTLPSWAQSPVQFLPCGQRQSYPPSTLKHIVSLAQLCLPISHSSMSTNQKQRTIKLVTVTVKTKLTFFGI